jgi:uncharacterized protein with PIN domain
MKLLADATLGRLAKWLRILGYDTAYLADADEYAVMRLARAEDRLILTRDRNLAGRRGIQVLVIRSEVLEEQLEQISTTVDFPEQAFSRCPVCNHPLVEAEPPAVATRVPPYVRETQRDFSICVPCDRVYWRGTHWERMQTLIAQLRRNAPRGLRVGERFDTMCDENRDS